MNLKWWSLGLILVTAACSSPMNADVNEDLTARPTREAEAWLATDHDSVALLRWTESGDQQLSGVLQLAQLEEYEVEGQCHGQSRESKVVARSP